MTGAVLAGPVVRAIQDQNVSPGVLGFLVVAALGVATWLLIRSMTRQIRKIDFAEDAVDLERQQPTSPEMAADGDDEAGPGGDLR